MKRTLLTALSALVIGSLSAQSFQIMDINMNNIANGSTIDLWYDVNATGPFVDFPVKNNASTSKVMKAKRNEISIVNGTNNVICWYVCYAPSVSVSQSVTVPANTTHTFTPHYYPNGNLGTSTIDYTFWDSLNPADSAWFRVKWHITPVGVNSLVAPSVSISNIFPNPAVNSTTISYQLANADNAIIRIYNVVGKEVRHEAVTSKEGTVTFNVSDLEPGIYFFSFICNEKVLATRKITVTH
jgi:hypothetical protein